MMQNGFRRCNIRNFFELIERSMHWRREGSGKVVDHRMSDFVGLVHDTGRRVRNDRDRVREIDSKKSRLHLDRIRDGLDRFGRIRIAGLSVHDCVTLRFKESVTCLREETCQHARVEGRFHGGFGDAHMTRQAPAGRIDEQAALPPFGVRLTRGVDRWGVDYDLGHWVRLAF